LWWLVPIIAFGRRDPAPLEEPVID
jgi:hypothetical protein